MPGGCESLRGQKQITYVQLRYGLQLFEANCIQLNGRGRLIMIPARSGRSTSIPLNTELHALLSFGAAMLCAGATAFRVRQWMAVMARTMDIDSLSVAFALGSVTASVTRGVEHAMMITEVGPPGVNVWRIGALEDLGKRAKSAMMPDQIMAEIAAIESAPLQYSRALTATAIGAACGAFAFLNNGGPFEVIAAGVGGGAGQGLRAWLARRSFNQYGVTALCALVASGVYVLIAMLCTQLGFGTSRHTAGFIASVLFLVPGFPLVGALLDLLQFETVVAISRLAYGVMIALTAAFGLSIVAGIVGFEVTPLQPLELSEALKLFLRGIASFVGGCGFAMVFNSSKRTVLAVGLLAFGANELRLALHDAGLMLAPATFLSALAVGLTASEIDWRLKAPRIAITVPAIIIMIPGSYAFQMVVQFNRGHMLEGLQAATLCGFVIGAMVMGLAAARFLSRREKVRDD